MKALVLGLAATLCLGLSASARQDPKPADPAPAADSIAGKWNLTVATQQGSMDNLLVLKQDGKKVTGTMSSQMGETPVSGEFADGKLALTMSFQGGNGQMDFSFNGKLNKDGSLSGTLSFGQMGDLEWTATRAKDKSVLR